MVQEYPDHEYESRRRRLPVTADDDGNAYESAGRYAGAWRDSGVRKTRRAANWTAAVLIAGVAATSGYFVHATASSPFGPASVGTSGNTGATQQPGTATTHGQKPSLTHPVVTSSGSGVTVGGSGSGGSGGGSATTWRDN